MNSNTLQQQLLAAVQNKFSKKQEMIQHLSKLLSVSTDGIYRRLRGDTVLSPNEISTLVVSFQISLDRILLDQSDTLLFSYNRLNGPVKSFRSYIESIYQNLSEVSKIQGTQIYYASQEIPIFQMAASGKKSLLQQNGRTEGGVFDLYYNEMITTNNTILVQSAIGKMAYLTVLHPNFLKSTDQTFCGLVENWFDMIMSQSSSISVHSAKSRNWYFNRLKKKVLATKEKIQNL